MSSKLHYNRYQLTYPQYSDTVYYSDNIDSVLQKCYREFIKLNDVQEGLFQITNLDTRHKYKYRIKNKLISHIGGARKSRYYQKQVRDAAKYVNSGHT